MTNEDVIVLCENAIECLEDQQGNWVDTALGYMFEIRAGLIDKGN